MASIARPAPTAPIRLARKCGAACIAVALILLLLAGAAGFFDRDPVSEFGPVEGHAPVAALFFSGDMGLRFGMGHHVVPDLAKAGIPVIGISTPAIFGWRRSRADVDRLLSHSIAMAQARTGARHIILIGQSFGADILASGLPTLLPQQRRVVTAAMLVVPGRDAYFRADPTGLAYHGTPDARPAAALRAMHGTPLICIYGAKEGDSLCPGLIGGRATVIELPGDHFLNHDYARLFATMMTTLRMVDPGLGRGPGRDRRSQADHDGAQALMRQVAVPSNDG